MQLVEQSSNSVEIRRPLFVSWTRWHRPDKHRLCNSSVGEGQCKYKCNHGCFCWVNTQRPRHSCFQGTFHDCGLTQLDLDSFCAFCLFGNADYTLRTHSIRGPPQFVKSEAFLFFVPFVLADNTLSAHSNSSSSTEISDGLLCTEEPQFDMFIPFTLMAPQWLLSQNHIVENEFSTTEYVIFVAAKPSMSETTC